MSATRGRILVIRGGAIGDFVLTLPVLAALRGRFPEARIEVLGYPHIAQLALAGGVVDRVQPIEARSLAGFFAAGGSLDPCTAEYFGRFDIIISYLFDPDAIFRTNVGYCSRAQFIQGPHRPVESEGAHATRVYLKPLERLAIYDADPVPHLNLPLLTRDVAAPLALHPGSGGERKNWPEQRWAELLQRLVNETALDLLLVGGEAEGDRLERLAALVPAERLKWVRSLALPDLAALLQGCAAFVGHDSGITHLAAAVDLPTLVLWGDTVEEIWRPQGSRVSILRERSGLSTLTVDRVIHALAAMISHEKLP